MFTRLRSTSLASAGAVVLVLMFAGLAFGRVVLNDSGTTVTADAPAAPDTTAIYNDINGNGIDDDCEATPAEPNPDAVAAELLLVDTNADGVISVTEAAHSDRIGGTNCNHGGYVSWVSQGSPDGTETGEQATDEAPPAECVEVPPPERDPALDEQKNGHGKWVSMVAQLPVIGGKNCNHGGVVSEAAKKDHDALKAERDAAKAARDAARAAAKAAKGHGKPH